MLKNILRGTFLILVLFLFLFSGQKNTVNGQTSCNVNSQNCPTRCSGKCSGSCMITLKWVCRTTDQACCWLKTCPADYEGWSADCKCSNVAQPAQCYWDAGCLQTNCSTSACCSTCWSGWSPCNSCYRWRYCQTLGNDAQESEWCCPDSTPNPSSTPVPPSPTCTVSLPANFSLAIGNTRAMDATITDKFGLVTQVNFSSDNASVASVNPASDTTANPYRAVVTGNSSGNSAVLRARVVMSAAVRCEAPDPGGTATPGPVFLQQPY